MNQAKPRPLGKPNRVDRSLPIICITVSLFSCLLMLSISANGFAGERIFWIQLLATALGIALSVAVSFLDYHWIVRWCPFFATLAVLLFLVLKIPELGFTPAGSDDAAWIKLGGLSIQPSEILKLVFVYTFAWHLSKVHRKINQLKIFLPLCLHGVIPIILVADTGDYGSALVFLAIFAVMLFAAGLSWRLMLVGTTAMIAVAPFIWMKLPYYLKERFFVAWNPSQYADGFGYQQYQGQLAMASGELFGRGIFGAEDLVSVPECYNDFIFSYIGQTLGFLGCVVTIILLGVLMLKILWIARQTTDILGGVICVGVFTMILIQSIINIGMVLCIFPVVGITLPFVSSGGTSLVISYLSIGMVLGVQRHMKKVG